MDNSIQSTPLEAVVLQNAAITRGTNDASVKTGVVTPTNGWQAVDLKPLLNHYYEALHGEISFRLTPPELALKQGYVLLNGTILKKIDFPYWAKVVANGLAAEVDDELFQMLDLTNLYLRPAEAGVGTVQEESVPNITGNTSGVLSNYGNGNWVGAGAVRLTSHWGKGYIQNGSANHRNDERQFTFNASLSHAAYGRRNEVAPRSMLVHAYAFVGRYEGPVQPSKTCYLLNADKTYAEATISLPGDVGYNPSHMTDLVPPALTDNSKLAKPEKLILTAVGWVKTPATK